MGKKKYVIEPKLALPTKHNSKKKKRRTSAQVLSLFLRELTLLIVLLDLANIAYWMFAYYPVYRIVSLIILVILWSNFASGTARQKTKEALDKLNTVSMQVVKTTGRRVRKYEEVLAPDRSEDTTGYLIAMKKESYMRIRTERVRSIVLPNEQRARM